MILRSKHPLPATSPRLLVAVSGGVDSVVLLHNLKSLGLHSLRVAHLNHGLRGRASNADESFVKKLARRWKIPVTTSKGSVKAYARKHKLSLETAARDVRYAFLFKTARRYGIQYILLAHHADDQIETFLQRLFRGSGIGGLTGMSPVTQREGFTLIRPLLEIRRKDILAYAHHHKLIWREDKSNRDTRHLRNRLRHELIPLIDHMFQRDTGTNLLRLMEILRAEEETFVVPPLQKELAVTNIRALPVAWQRRLIHAWLTQLHQISNCGFDEVEAVRKLSFKGQSIPRTNLSGNRHVVRKKGFLHVEK